MNDPTTWGVTAALPFIRPCQGLCTDTTSGSCGAVLTSLGMSPNCSSVVKAGVPTYVSVAEQTAYSRTCNDMSTQTVTVTKPNLLISSATEKCKSPIGCNSDSTVLHDTSHVCASVVNYTYYLPAGYTPTSLANMIPSSSIKKFFTSHGCRVPDQLFEVIMRKSI